MDKARLRKKGSRILRSGIVKKLTRTCPGAIVKNLTEYAHYAVRQLAQFRGENFVQNDEKKFWKNY